MIENVFLQLFAELELYALACSLCQAGIQVSPAGTAKAEGCVEYNEADAGWIGDDESLRSMSRGTC